MLYGRRVIEPQISNTQRAPSRFILNRNFQYKYCWYLLTAIAGGCFFFFAPSYFFISQNYDLFRNLAFDTQPQLVEHLERELMWLKAFFVLGFSTICALVLYLSLRVTKQLLTPIVAIEKHMFQVSAGKLNVDDFYLDEAEDFKELSLTYEYLYKSLQERSLKEVELLKKIDINSMDRESYAIWKQLLTDKQNSLGIQEELMTSENVVSLSEFDQKRRAS